MSPVQGLNRETGDYRVGVREGEHAVKWTPAKAAKAVEELAQKAADEKLLAGQRERALGAATAILSSLKAADRCCNCGRDLTDPRSKARGIGPDCLAKLKAEAELEDRFRTTMDLLGVTVDLEAEPEPEEGTVRPDATGPPAIELATLGLDEGFEVLQLLNAETEPLRERERIIHDGGPHEYADHEVLARLRSLRYQRASVAERLRELGLGVCRVCYCTDWSACEPGCAWSARPDVCTECVVEDLERAYLETLGAIGTSTAFHWPATSIQPGDAVDAHLLQERVVKVATLEGITTVETPTRTLVWRAGEPVTIRRGVPEWASLVDPTADGKRADEVRREVVLAAYHAGRGAFVRPAAERLLGIDLDTLEPLPFGPTARSRGAAR